MDTTEPKLTEAQIDEILAACEPEVLEPTPGPWSHRSGNAYFQKTGNLHTGKLIMDSNGQWIAAVWQDVEGGPDRQEANARLIAAAPELLAALLKAEELMRWSYDVENGSGSAIEAQDAISAAIAKARSL